MKMKIKIGKVLIALVLATSLLFVGTTVTRAEGSHNLLPPWFLEAIKPVQDAITQLVSRVDNHEQRISELENRVVELQQEIDNLKPRQIDPGDIGTLQIDTGGNGESGYIPTPTPTPTPSQ